LSSSSSSPSVSDHTPSTSNRSSLSARKQPEAEDTAVDIEMNQVESSDVELIDVESTTAALGVKGKRKNEGESLQHRSDGLY
jgi:hypothetical protein